MIIRRIDVLSLGIFFGLLYGGFGFLIGVLLTGINILTMIFGEISSYDSYFSVSGVLCGLGAFLVLPVLFAVVGFFSGCVTALISNLALRISGGLKIDAKEIPSRVPSPSSPPPAKT